MEGDLVFYVNDSKIVIPKDEVDVEVSVADFLRVNLMLSGTKQCCGEGGCSSCANLLTDIDGKTNKIRHRLINTCLIPLPYIHGKKITTVEGVGTVRENTVHAVQERLAKQYGSQCGYCSPGFIVSTFTQLEKKKKSTVRDIENCISGNLCRCTGYRPIVESLRSLGVDFDETTMASALCKEGKKTCQKKLLNESVRFPREELEGYVNKSFKFSSRKKLWFCPSTFEELLELKAKHCDEKSLIVGGNTDIGFERRYHIEQDFRVYISTTNNYIPEIDDIKIEEGKMTVGSAVTIEIMDRVLLDRIKQLEENGESFKSRGFRAIQDQVSTFGNPAIRAVGTIGGSVVTADPLSDLYPILVALKSQVTLTSKSSKRVLSLKDFVLGENKVDIRPDEILENVIIPETKKSELCASYKQSRRKYDDQCLINAAFRVDLGDEKLVKDISIVFGGIARTPCISAEKTEKFFLGKKLSKEREALEGFDAVVREEAKILTTLPRGSKSYKRTMIYSLLVRFFFGHVIRGMPLPRDEKKEDGPTDLKYSQSIPPYPPQPSHLEALHHATGEALFTADNPLPNNGLFGSPILSKNPHADFEFGESLDEIVKNIPEVKAIITAKDVKGVNFIGSIAHDEQVFASKTSHYYGQVLGLVVATSMTIAREVSRKIKIKYHSKPFIGTLKEAIEKESYIESHDPMILERGNVKEVFQREDCVTVEGEYSIGGQEHMYIEPCAALATPTGPRSIELVTTVQNPTLVQRMVAKVLGWKQHNVISRVDRIGGGFGGKQDRPIFIAAEAAVAAEKLGVPVLVELSRDEDFQISGQRHEFYGKYKLCCEKKTGKIVGLDIMMYNNGGNSMDLSPEVMKVAAFSIDGGYYFPNYRIEGKTCRTNRVSCTAFRGFGKPQAQAFTETFMNHANQALFPEMDPAEFRAKNLVKKGMKWLENHPCVNNNLESTWELGMKVYQEEKKKVEEFNRRDNAEEEWWKRRGIGISPIKANCFYDLDWMNQASALVHIFQDGTIMCCHSGVEMGQGLHTKMAQIVANEFNVSVDKVVVSGTSTEKNPNTVATAAVSGTGLNGGALINACKKIKERLKGYDRKTLSFEEIIEKAFFDRVNLSANGYYATPKFGYDFKKKTGSYSYYFIWATSVSVVEVDLLTGQFELIRNDIFADVGKSINNAIDVGQVEGGFAQGLGLYTLEELVWARSDAHLRSRNVSTYKIPTVEDMPKEWNITFLDTESERGVYSSKACGEIGVSCAISVTSAITDVIWRESKQVNVPSDFPVTVEKIRMAMKDPYIVE